MYFKSKEFSTVLCLQVKYSHRPKKCPKTQVCPMLILSCGRVVLSVGGALLSVNTSHSKYTGNKLVLHLYLILLGAGGSTIHLLTVFSSPLYTLVYMHTTVVLQSYLHEFETAVLTMVACNFQQEASFLS